MLLRCKYKPLMPLLGKKIDFCDVNHMMATQVDLHTVAKYSRSVEFSNANECGLFCQHHSE